jgi:hypothetical protein
LEFLVSFVDSESNCIQQSVHEIENANRHSRNPKAFCPNSAILECQTDWGNRKDSCQLAPQPGKAIPSNGVGPSYNSLDSDNMWSVAG